MPTVINFVLGHGSLHRGRREVIALRWPFVQYMGVGGGPNNTPLMMHPHHRPAQRKMRQSRGRQRVQQPVPTAAGHGFSPQRACCPSSRPWMGNHGRGCEAAPGCNPAVA